MAESRERKRGRSSLPLDILDHAFSPLHHVHLQKEEEEDEERRGDWSSLPLELLEQLLPHLHLIDLLAFRATCRQWRLASTIALPYSQPPTSTPWLLFYGALQTPECFLYNPSAQTSYSIQLPELQGAATCISSDGGWLLVLRPGGSIFFFNPFSRARIDLPNLPPGSTPFAYVAICSSSPTSEDCTVYVVNLIEDEYMCRVELHVCQRGDIGWTRYTSPPHEFPFRDLLCLRLHPEKGLLFTYYRLAVAFWFDRSEFWFDPLPSRRGVLDYVAKEEVELIRLCGMGVEVMRRLFSWKERCTGSLGAWITEIYTSGTFLDWVDGKPIWISNAWDWFFPPRDGLKAVCVRPRFDKMGLNVW